MEKNFVLNGNKLIAEFMGYKLNKNNNYNISYITVQGLWDDCALDDLKYHESWDWLMPVVEEIEEIDVVASFQIEQPSIYIWSSSENSSFEDIEIDIFNKTKIQAVYEAVIKFIEWYNENKK